MSSHKCIEKFPHYDERGDLDHFDMGRRYYALFWRGLELRVYRDPWALGPKCPEVGSYNPLSPR